MPKRPKQGPVPRKSRTMAKKPPIKSTLKCEHSNLIFSSSSHAESIGYKQPALEQRIAATTPTGTLKPKIQDTSAKRDAESSATFPAPLVLPRDDLALDPTYPAQSLRSWIREKDRNKITPDRRTVYLAAPPGLHNGTGFVGEWAHPSHLGQRAKKIQQPDARHVLDYLKAFYHGLPVKMLPSEVFTFTLKHDDILSTEKQPPGLDRRIIGLSTQTPSGRKGIRTRPTPDGLFSHQLNLDDLLDAAIWALPDDAYALVLLVEQDLYEDEEDEFVCGRAYGGSRVAVVSTARYHPSLDEVQEVEREHAWPASCCSVYVQACCVDGETGAGRAKKKGTARATPSVLAHEDASTSPKPENTSPLYAALSAHTSLPSLSSSQSSTCLSGLWLSRVCRTVSHELGHCFGMDHCIYYACSMQGSASIIEDARQPPYLCPVDSAKLLRATGGDAKERYEAILMFCEKYESFHLFAAYGAWVRARLKQL